MYFLIFSVKNLRIREFNLCLRILYGAIHSETSGIPDWWPQS